MFAEATIWPLVDDAAASAAVADENVVALKSRHWKREAVRYISDITQRAVHVTGSCP
jgi:hypothetical protein